MDTTPHTLSTLFAQLGLANDHQSIEDFITQHSPLPRHIEIVDAPWWTAAQAAFLKEALEEDADWAILVDELAVRLSE